MTAFRPKRILTAFDFSRQSLEAWRYARELAARVGARLEAVYVSPWLALPGECFAPPIFSSEEQEELREKLRVALGQDAAAHVVCGDVVGEILATCRGCRSDLIVMATSGRVGLRHAVLGSLTEALVRLSPVPVLSLRGPAGPPKRVLAPVKLEEYSLAGLRAAADVASAFGASLTVLHVAEPSERPDLGTRLEAAIRSALPGVELALKLAQGEPVAAITREAASHDLVVLATHRRGVFRGGLLGSTAERVLRRSTAPVLSVPPASVGALTRPEPKA